MAAIELTNVRKQFDGVTAVNNLDLTVNDTEIFGFLGPNGAGKSTTINLMLDFVRPSDGNIRVLGMSPRDEGVAIRQRTGVLPEGFDVYDRLTGRQHLTFAIQSKEASDDPDRILDRVGLAEAGGRKAGGYSTGMRQRLALGMALIGDPDLLILDEPSTGLDPNGAREMREIVRAENERGATVFFSSHILGQVEAVCDRVGILRDGSLVAQDSVEGLRDAVGVDATLRITVDAGTDVAVEAIHEVDGVTSVGTDGATIEVGCTDDAKTSVLAAIESAGVEVSDFETEEASLEDLFVAYTEADDR